MLVLLSVLCITFLKEKVARNENIQVSQSYWWEQYTIGVVFLIFGDFAKNKTQFQLNGTHRVYQDVGQWFVNCERHPGSDAAHTSNLQIF